MSERKKNVLTPVKLSPEATWGLFISHKGSRIIVNNQLQRYLDEHGILSHFQSGFRKLHCTVTASQKVLNHNRAWHFVSEITGNRPSDQAVGCFSNCL